MTWRAWPGLLFGLLVCGCRPAGPEPATMSEPPSPRAEPEQAEPASVYALDPDCSDCADAPGACLTRVADGTRLGCGWADEERSNAISFAIEESATEDLDRYPGGFVYLHRYQFWSSLGQPSGEWVVCDDYGAGCEASFSFVPGRPLALYNYGETGAGGSQNGLVVLEAGGRLELRALGAIDPVASPDGTRLAYEDLRDYGNVQVDPATGAETLVGSIWSLDLDELVEVELASPMELGVAVEPDDEVRLRWLDDERLEVELIRDGQSLAKIVVQ